MAPKSNNWLGCAALIALAGCATCKDEVGPQVRQTLGITEKDLDQVLDKTEHNLEKNYEPMMILKRAEAHFKRAEYIEAEADYNRFLELHPLHPQADYAQYKLGSSWNCQVRSIDRDPEPAQKALAAFQKLLDNYPKTTYAEAATGRIKQLQDDLARYDLYVARYYFKKEAYSAAIVRLEKLAAERPRQPEAADALALLAQALYASGKRDAAADALRRLLDQYPGAKTRPEIQKLRHELQAAGSPSGTPIG